MTQKEENVAAVASWADARYGDWTPLDNGEYIRRVPGGWLYRLNGNTGSIITFIPGAPTL
jgi:hypothetical protein